MVTGPIKATPGSVGIPQSGEADGRGLTAKEIAKEILDMGNDETSGR